MQTNCRFNARNSGKAMTRGANQRKTRQLVHIDGNSVTVLRITDYAKSRAVGSSAPCKAMVAWYSSRRSHHSMQAHKRLVAKTLYQGFTFEQHVNQACVLIHDRLLQSSVSARFAFRNDKACDGSSAENRFARCGTLNSQLPLSQLHCTGAKYRPRISWT